MAAIGVGAFFAFCGWLIRPKRTADEVRTDGTITTSWRGWGGGQRTWRYQIEFRDTSGVVRVFEPSLSRGRPRAVGERVEVAYLPSDPAATARRTDGVDGKLHWVFVVIGICAAVVFSLLL